MPEQTPKPEPYGFQYTETGIASRKELPLEAMAALFDVLDKLTADPDAFPGRTSVLDPAGTVRLYKHPAPPLHVFYRVDSARRVLYLLHFVAPRMQATRPVFVSYAHEDSEWLKKLRKFLRPLEDRELIQVFDDSEIAPGSDWLNEIRQALASARVAVFLVTQNFLDSKFIQEKELPVLLQAASNRGCLIFWIAVSSSTFEDSPLASIQGANRPTAPLDLMSEAEQAKVLKEIYEKMKNAVSVD